MCLCIKPMRPCAATHACSGGGGGTRVHTRMHVLSDRTNEKAQLVSAGVRHAHQFRWRADGEALQTSAPMFSSV